jgi:hypothetical protein
MKPKAKPKAPGKAGRPRKELPEDLMIRAAAMGLTDVEIANLVGINVETYYARQRENRVFSEAIKNAKAKADLEVVAGLYKRATGFDAPDVHVAQFEGQIIITKLRKYYPPDPTSCAIWLNNRRKEQWRPVNKIELSGPNGSPLIPSKRDPHEELAEMLAESGIDLVKTNGKNGNGKAHG